MQTDTTQEKLMTYTHNVHEYTYEEVGDRQRS